jgi:type II secretion system protein N
MARLTLLNGRIRTVLDALAACRPVFDPRSAAPWAAYGLLLFLAVFGFRYAALNADVLLNERLADVSGLRINVSGTEPGLLPPGAHIGSLNVFDAATDKPVFSMRDADLRLHLFPLFLSKLALSAEGKTYGGRARVEVESGRLFDWGGGRLSLALDTVDLAAIPQVAAYDPTMTGFASVDTEVVGRWGDPKGLTGYFRATLDRVDMRNRIRLIRAKRLKDCRVEMDLTLKEGSLTAETFSVRGENDITFSGKGTIAVAPEFLKSRVALQGSIRGPSVNSIDEAFPKNLVDVFKARKQIAVLVAGTVQAPVLQAR